LVGAEVPGNGLEGGPAQRLVRDGESRRYLGLTRFGFEPDVWGNCSRVLLRALAMISGSAAHVVFVAVFAFLVFPQEIGPAALVSADALADGVTAHYRSQIWTLDLEPPPAGY